MGLREPHVAIDATTTIPTRIRLVGIIYAHSYDILACSDVRGDIVLEAGIAVRTIAHLLTIHINGGIHIDTIELEEKTLFGKLRDRKVLAIPAHATREGSTASATGIAYVEIALDSPVVGHGKRTPMAIVVIYLRHLGRVAQ